MEEQPQKVKVRNPQLAGRSVHMTLNTRGSKMASAIKKKRHLLHEGGLHNSRKQPEMNERELGEKMGVGGGGGRSGHGLVNQIPPNHKSLEEGEKKIPVLE